MGFPKSAIGLGVLAAAASANAGVLGYSVDNYLVVDGANRYSVMDVYVNCSNQFDKVVNFFGQSTAANNAFVRTTRNGVQNAGDASSATNGAPFAQGAGTGWMPTAAGDTKSWDSFVTMGARTQTSAAATQSIGPDPYFVNGLTAGANTLQGGYNGTPAYIGPGWQANLPNSVEGSAGAWGDKRLMLGRFTVDVTGYTNADTLSLQFHGKLTMKVNGTVFGGGTTSQPLVDQNFVYNTFVIPTPGALALAGLAGVVSRRRKA